MIEALLARCEAEWPAWVGHTARTPLQAVALGNTRVVERRLTLVVFERSARRPEVVLKVGGSPAAGHWLRAEWANLQVAARASVGTAWSAPAPVALLEGDTGPVLVARAVPGRPTGPPPAGEGLLARPRLTWWLRRQAVLFDILGGLAPDPGAGPPPQSAAGDVSALVDRLMADLDQPGRQALGRLVDGSSAGLRAPPRWQHGDVVPANVLVARGGPVTLIDWELAGWYEPWFDQMCLLLMPAFSDPTLLRHSAATRFLRDVVVPRWQHQVPLVLAGALTAARGAERAERLGRGAAERWLALAQLLLVEGLPETVPLRPPDPDARGRR